MEELHRWIRDLPGRRTNIDVLMRENPPLNVPE
jgi:hypothetical protein